MPISAEQVKAMAADATTHLLQSLGLRIRQPTVDDDPRRYRGVKKSVILGKTWKQRCKGWRHGTNKKKGPDGEFSYRGAENPITMRWDADDKNPVRRSPAKNSALTLQDRWLWKLMIWPDTKSR